IWFKNHAFTVGDREYIFRILNIKRLSQRIHINDVTHHFIHLIVRLIELPFQVVPSLSKPAGWGGSLVVNPWHDWYQGGMLVCLVLKGFREPEQISFEMNTAVKSATSNLWNLAGNLYLFDQLIGIFPFRGA